MNPYQSLTESESAAIVFRFLLKLLAVPVSVWSAIYLIRRGFGILSGSLTEITPTLKPYALAVTVVFFLIYFAALCYFFRTDGGRPFFDYARTQPTTGENSTGVIVAALALSSVFFYLYALWILDGMMPFDSFLAPTIFTVPLTLPMARALMSRAVHDGEKVRFMKRRNARITAAEEAEERRRREALIVPPPPPETFESRLSRITAEHEQRQSQLQRVPIDEEERQYLIELETTRFKEAIRALTDPSLGPSNTADGDGDFPT